MSELEGLSPADELELRRRRDADAEKARNATMNELIRAEYRRAKGKPPRQAGRPGWPPELFRERLAAARAATSPPHTWLKVNANFVRLDGQLGYEDPDTLRKLERRYRAK